MKATAVVLLVLAFTVYVIPADRPRPKPLEPLTNLAQSETARIQHHLATVELELLTKDVSALSPSQRGARRDQIRRLREYRLAGRFPHNHQFPGRRVPYFTDQHGTLCAMAHLIATSGGRDIVDQVTRTANNATVWELAQDPGLGPALASWLKARGLTIAEAQSIQPEYYFRPPPTKITAEYGAASCATGALNIASVIVNGSATNSRGRGWIPLAGIVTGSAEVLLGMAKLEGNNPARTLGVVNIMVGAVSIVASGSALLRSPERELAEVRSSASGLAVAPMAGVDRVMNPVVGLRAAF